MTTVDEQLKSVDEVFSMNIRLLRGERGLLSQNLLAQLRNLVEAVAVRLHLGDGNEEFHYDRVKHAISFVRSMAQFNFLGRFHRLLQSSASHYTLDGDASERLMLKYYEYLHRIRDLARSSFGAEVLANLEDFPVDLDPAFSEYHRKIVDRIKAVHQLPADEFAPRRRFYIHKVRPFFVDGMVYYEVTFFKAVNKVSKFDRIIGFTDIDISDRYAASLVLVPETISVLDQQMPITVIRGWEVSIRPCELSNFARFFGISADVRSSTTEYRYLMSALTAGRASLLDVMEMTEDVYIRVRESATSRVARPQIFPALDQARRIVRAGLSGHNVVRYLLLRMNNQILKSQYSEDPCGLLSGMHLKFGCVPFETMPFCTSLVYHNPRISDLLDSLDSTTRVHEVLARRIKNNVENEGRLYTSRSELEEFGDVDELVTEYNSKLYWKHRSRRQIEQDMGKLFIREYEDDTVAIIQRLTSLTSQGISGYESAVERWLSETAYRIDDEAKLNSLRMLFSDSRVALVYGAAGTGKSTMVNHIANFFNDKRKLFLAQTNPAVDNLKRRVTTQNATFRTVSSQLARSIEPECDVLVIDECSTVSNSDLLQVLQRVRFRLLVLVGDVYQIESIRFGNWFGVIRSFVPEQSVFELTTPYRTKNNLLLQFWDKVRHISDDISESIARNGYASALDSSLLERRDQDEIILCLNYDGLYGINNINRFLQSSNPGPGVTWGLATYKVGDPVLFNETERFRPVIYNNLKGKIVRIASDPEMIQFDVEVDRAINEFDVTGLDLVWVGDSTVRFEVYDLDNSDEDDDALNTTVPFQVAYAVSIHKAQGLEYNSVKIVVTDANEGDISHNVFYTAVTRARENLKIYWTPETQASVLSKLHRDASLKDVAILTHRRGLVSIA